jgi:hypothetical protein
MRRILLFPQDKGGVGKSFVATLLYDHLVDLEVSFKAFDLDHANSTFHRFVPESEFIDTDVEISRLGVLDRLVHALDEVDTVLVDNRASGGEKVLHYLRDAQLTSLQEELDCRLVFVVIATDDKDANSQIADLVDEYANEVGWLIARNNRDGTQLPLFDASRSRERLLSIGAIEVDIPALAEVTRNRLQMANLTVGRGRDAAELHLLDRSRCVRYHHMITAEFEKARSLIAG